MSWQYPCWSHTHTLAAAQAHMHAVFVCCTCCLMHFCSTCMRVNNIFLLLFLFVCSIKSKPFNFLSHQDYWYSSSWWCCCFKSHYENSNWQFRSDSSSNQTSSSISFKLLPMQVLKVLRFFFFFFLCHIIVVAALHTMLLVLLC